MCYRHILIMLRVTPFDVGAYARVTRVITKGGCDGQITVSRM